MRSLRQQAGFALLIFIIVMIGLGAFGISKLLETRVEEQGGQSQKKSQLALQQAKEALLSYAIDAIVDDAPGRIGKLPCPDVSGSWNLEGSQDPVCGDAGANSFGLFPFKTVGLGKIEDGEGQCLWYAVSANYKNAPSIMLNWDRGDGMLNVENELGVLKHGNVAEDFPVAVLIAPGAPISGQDRTPSPDLPLCGGNFAWGNYLEGGPNLNYSTYTEDDVGSVWSFLEPSLSVSLENKNFNDRIVYITQKEIWDRIRKAKALDPDYPNSAIRKLTENLAQCLIAYANEDATTQTLIYGGQLVLADYQDKSQYKDVDGRLYGRFPQNIRESNHHSSMKLSHLMEKIFVARQPGNSYCETQVGLNEEFWENWKDHFYLVTAADFAPNTTLLYNYSARCSNPGGCLSINGRTNVAAIVFFAGEKTAGQTRDITPYFDDNSAAQRLGLWNEYMNGGNQHLYDGTAVTNDYVHDAGDFAFCIVKNPGGLSAEPC